ncbi:MAG: RND family efflux transporter MFP subunit [Bermanella sp.]|jgi:RND family efflux transporter MFP subunit
MWVIAVYNKRCIWLVLRKLINLIFSVLILAAALLAAQELIANREPLHSNPREEKGPLVTVYRLREAGADIRLNTHGTVQAKTSLQLTSDVAGRITWVSGELLVGKILDAGLAIARVDKSQYELAAAQATLALRDAELSLADAYSRFKTRNPRHPQIRRAEAQVFAANAQIKKARIDLQRTEIILPTRALVSSKNIALGQYVSPGSVLASLDSVDAVEVPLPLSLDEVNLLANTTGASIRLTPVNGDSETHWTATLARINQQLDSNTRVAYAIAEVSEPYAHALNPLRIGQFVNAEISGIHLDNVFRIPTKAIFENRYVYRLTNEQHLQRVKIDILRQDKSSVVARAALSAGDTLVLSRLDIMTDGMQVRLDDQP